MARSTEENLKEAQLRKEYFAKGGKVHRYPPGVRGASNLLRTSWGRLRLHTGGNGARVKHTK